MTTDEFFAYLRRSPATRHLSDELSRVVRQRASTDLVQSATVPGTRAA